MNLRSLLNPAFLTAFLLMGAAGIGIKTGIDRFNIYLQKKPIYAEPGPDGAERVLRAIPTETQNWIRLEKDQLVPPEELEVLGTNNYLTRYYVEKNPRPNSKPRVIELHAAYYTETIDTVPHVAERCFTGAGMSLTGGPWVIPLKMNTTDWAPAPSLPAGREGQVYTTRLSNEYSTSARGKRVTLPIGLTPDKPLDIRITRYATPKSNKSYYAGYFFLGNGGWVSSAEQVRLLSFDLRQDYAYYAKVQFGSADAETPEDLADMAASLMNDLLGEIMTCVPDWMKVERGDWPQDNPKKMTATK